MLLLSSCELLFNAYGKEDFSTSFVYFNDVFEYDLFIFENYELVSYPSNGIVSGARSFSNDILEFEFMNFDSNYPKFKLTNKSSESLSIIWDSCVFIDETGRSHKVFKSELRFVERDQPISPSVVIPSTHIIDYFVPVYAAQWEDNEWVVSDSIPKSSGKTIGLVFAINHRDSMDNYIFKFESYGRIVQRELTIPFAFVSKGSFIMGDRWNQSKYENSRPSHDVTLEYDFYIGKTEVTFDEYDSFCEVTGRTKPDDEGWGRGTRPVINVSWWDAIAYCNWLSEKNGVEAAYDELGNFLDKNGRITTDPSKVVGYRLPTEAEWEYAARGGNKSEGYRYSGSSNLEEVAWYMKNSYFMTHEVGLKKPNELGIYDMSGNVWEWCSDWECDYTHESQVNPYNHVPDKYSHRMMRGSTFADGASAFWDGSDSLLVDRGGLDSNTVWYFTGFRIARTVP